MSGWRPKLSESFYKQVWEAYRINDKAKLYELIGFRRKDGYIVQRPFLLWHARRKYGDLRGRYEHRGGRGWKKLPR